MQRWRQQREKDIMWGKGGKTKGEREREASHLHAAALGFDSRRVQLESESLRGPLTRSGPGPSHRFETSSLAGWDWAAGRVRVAGRVPGRAWRLERSEPEGLLHTQPSGK